MPLGSVRTSTLYAALIPTFDRLIRFGTTSEFPVQASHADTDLSATRMGRAGGEANPVSLRRSKPLPQARESDEAQFKGRSSHPAVKWQATL